MWKDLSEFGDYEILNFKNQEDGLNLELRELIGKVTAFSQFISPCRDMNETCQTVGKMQALCAKKVGDLFEN